MSPNIQLSTEKQTAYTDEIDLVALCVKVWNGRWKIVGAVLICILFGVVYLLVTPKTYLINTMIAPPTAVDLDPIQPQHSGGRYRLPAMQSREVYALVKGYLRAENKKLGFWYQYFDLDSEGVLGGESLEKFLLFNRKLKVTEGKKDDVTVTLTLMSQSPDNDVQMLEKFLIYINKQVIEHLVSNMKAILNIQKNKLVADIALARKHYQTDLQDQIASLKEAISIAKTIGIKETPYEQLANVEMKVVDNRFLLGTKTLLSQLEVLEGRQDNDTFVPGLRTLQNQVDRMEAELAILQTYQNEVRAFRVLQPVSRSLKEESPKKILILALAVLVGGFWGLFWIFMSGLIDAVHQREVKES